jgi:L,D-transpeptidase catalytic domain
MRSGSLLSASLIAVAWAIPFATLANAAIVVHIDKTKQQMSISVDGTPRYVWQVSTGRPGYDTPNGTFKANRMDADHLSQEWDNAPMPHTIFFDMQGHAIHGFSDVKHLGLPVSHGCVRLSPNHAATLFDLVKAEGVSQATVVVSGQTPAGSPGVARRRAPVEQASRQPMEIAPVYAQRQLIPGYGQPAPYDAQAYYRQPQPYYGQRQQPYYAQQQRNYQPPQPPPVYQLRLFSPN